MMVPGADAADTGHDAGKFLRRTALHELFKAAQAHDGHTRVRHIAVGVQVDIQRGMALDARQGRDADNIVL